MRLVTLATLLSLWAGLCAAFEVEGHIVYEGRPGGSTLRIISTGDREAFEPLIRAFQQQHPEVTVDYTITGTSELMKALYDEGAAFDLAVSSAMDLQTKLANDGLALSYRSDATEALPDWARWRDQIFAFTQEPAVLVLSAREFAGRPVPANREELIAMLRETPERFAGRIGTYDVRSSGYGYLMATQDSRQSDSFWRLTEVMGRLDTRLYCCSGDMIRDVEAGRLAIAYNVLGSYAATQAEADGALILVELSDFVNVMLRSALIPKTAENVAAAERMVDFLVTLRARPDLVAASGLPAIDAQALAENTALRPIRFGPGLLVFLDRLTRGKFLRAWESSMEQE